MENKTLKPYADYKPSGIDWLGDVPSHWDVRRIKSLSVVKRGASPRPIDDPKYFDENGEYAWVRISDVTASNHYLQKTTQRLSEIGQALSVKVEPGDMFLSIAGSVGKPIITSIKCCIHDGFVYFPYFKGNVEFLYRILSIEGPFAKLGKLGTQLNLNTDTVGNIYIGCPSTAEQATIVRYLDRAADRIRRAISAKERLIALLTEQRQAVIHRAVTRGLDPDVPLKDSGVEWLGDVPAHWEIGRMKVVANIRYGLGQPPRESATGLPLIRATNVSRGHIVEKDLLHVDPKDVPPGRDAFLREKEIIVVRSGAYTADSAIIPEAYAGSVTGYDMVLTVKRAVPEFIAAALLSKYLRDEQLIVASNRAAQPHLNAEELGTSVVLLPPLLEQAAIVGYLDKATADIDTAIDKAQRQIDLLREYRTRLIADVVTGQVDVRQKEFTNGS